MNYWTKPLTFANSPAPVQTVLPENLSEYRWVRTLNWPTHHVAVDSFPGGGSVLCVVYVFPPSLHGECVALRPTKACQWQPSERELTGSHIAKFMKSVAPLSGGSPFSDYQKKILATTLMVIHQSLF